MPCRARIFEIPTRSDLAAINVHASGAHTATMRAGAQRWTDGLTLKPFFTGAMPLKSVTCVCSTALAPMPPERGRSPVDEFMHGHHAAGARSGVRLLGAHAGDMRSEVSVDTYVFNC